MRVVWIFVSNSQQERDYFYFSKCETISLGYSLFWSQGHPVLHHITLKSCVDPHSRMKMELPEIIFFCIPPAQLSVCTHANTLSDDEESVMPEKICEFPNMLPEVTRVRQLRCAGTLFSFLAPFLFE